MPLAPGDVLDHRYAIRGTLGAGGMGRVYRAWDEKLRRPVALKVLHVDEGEGEEGRRRAAARLLREARAAAALDHVNAVAIHDVGEFEGTTFIAMELVDGHSLRAYVGDQSISLATRTRWIADVARALQAAHARGLVHRDVKPENVMLRHDGTIKVLDFGIARPMDGAGTVAPPWQVAPFAPSTASVSALAGTPRYMAPEQLLGEVVDARADQFAWGVLAYELLTGSPPWPGDATSCTVLARIQTEDPPPPSAIVPAIPAAVSRAIMRTLAKEPSDRFPAMGELLEALEGRPADAPSPRASARGEVALTDLTAHATSGEPRPARRARLRLAVAAALALAAIGALGARWWTRTTPRAASQVARVDGAWTPRTLPGLVLWLDAADAPSAPSGAWPDRSDHHNDAVWAGSPSEPEGTIAGKPAVHFDGASYMVVKDSPAIRLGAGDFVAAMIVQHTTPTQGGRWPYGCLFTKQLPKYPWVGPGLFANTEGRTAGIMGQVHYQTGRIETTKVGWNDGRPFVVVLRRAIIDEHAATLNVRVNREDVATATAAEFAHDVSADGAELVIGGTVHAQNLRGDVAELVLVKGSLVNAEFDALEHYLMSKYGISSEHGPAR